MLLLVLDEWRLTECPFELNTSTLCCWCCFVISKLPLVGGDSWMQVCVWPIGSNAQQPTPNNCLSSLFITFRHWHTLMLRVKLRLIPAMYITYPSFMRWHSAQRILLLFDIIYPKRNYVCLTVLRCSISHALISFNSSMIVYVFNHNSIHPIYVACPFKDLMITGTCLSYYQIHVSIKLLNK